MTGELAITAHPDDFVGSDRMTGIAYLFRGTAQILVIQGDAVTLTEYFSRRELDEKWSSITDDFEPSGEPDEHDYVIEKDDDGLFVLRDNAFNSIDNVLLKVKEYVDEERSQGLTPTVWFRTRHNNFKVVDLE
jgi:hypothetical protein